MSKRKSGKKKSAKRQKRSAREKEQQQGRDRERGEAQEDRRRDERKGEPGGDQKDGRKEERKDALVPQEDAGEERSASGLFKEAIAAFESAEAPPADAREASRREDEPARDDAEREAGDERPGRAEIGEKTEERRGEERAEEEVEPKTPGERRDEGEGESPGRTARQAAEAPKDEAEGEDAAEVQEAEEAEEAEPAEAEPAAPVGDRMVRKALRKEGKPGEEIEAYEPKEYELHGDLVKFECRCGKRVSAPARVKRSVGRCPKCGVRLVLPKPERTGDDAPGAGEGPRPASSGVTWVTRLVAFLIDVAVPAALFFALFCLLRSLQVAADRYWTAALALAVGTWLIVAIVLPWAVSASLGMLVVGLRYRGPDGRRLSFIEAVGRAVMGVVLSPLAPLSLADPWGRTTADHATGCAVVPSGAGPSAARTQARGPAAEEAAE